MNKEEVHAVIGATGGLGSAVVRKLAGDGRKVRAISRGELKETFENVEHVPADVLNRESIESALQGSGIVYNCVNMPYHKWPELFPTAMENIIQAVERAEAPMVFGDNLYMYGHVDGPIREDSPMAATGKKGKVRIALTEMVLEAHEKGRIRVVIGRGSDFYGPGSYTGFGELAIVPAIKGKRAQALGDIDQPHTWTFTDDFASALLLLGDSEETYGDVWHVPSAEAITTRKLIEMAYQKTGNAPAKISTAGPLLISILGLFNPVMGELKEMMYEWQNPYIVDHSKFAARFGDISTPHDEALAQTIGWFKKHQD